MNTLLSSLPEGLKDITIPKLEEFFCFEEREDVIQLQKAFEPYAKKMALALSQYLSTHPYVNETDQLLESERIRRRVKEENPEAVPLDSSREEYVRQRRNLLWRIKTDFTIAGGRAEQFEALIEIAESNVLLKRKQGRPQAAPGAPFLG